MVAIVNFNESLSHTLNYNEKKVQRKVATFLGASGFLQPDTALTYYNKLERFQDLHALNTRTKKKVVHITLNFHPTEKIEECDLKDIATEFMERIGFGNQPYLIYEHKDAGHQHLHIVSTLIQPVAKRIGTHNIGKTKAKAARLELEAKYGLVSSTKKEQKAAYQLKPIDPDGVQYGKSETRQSIAGVLDAVIKQYNYTTLEELNAVLRLSNVEASRGNEASRIYKTGGLVYRIIDKNGKREGKSIKASAFFSAPTLKVLQEQFKTNLQSRDDLKAKLKKSIDQAYQKNAHMGINQLAGALKAEKIRLVLHQNSQQFIYGITFVDQKNKSVFKGSDIGKQYTVAALQKRAIVQTQLPLPEQYTPRLQPERKTPPFGLPSLIERTSKSADPFLSATKPLTSAFPGATTELFENLLPENQPHNPTPYELTGKKKKKKRRPRLD
jgi:hypothetical protein